VTISEAWIGTSWIVEVMANVARFCILFLASYLFLTRLPAIREALLLLARLRCSID